MAAHTDKDVVKEVVAIGAGLENPKPLGEPLASSSGLVA